MKSGTNTLHGTAFALGRDAALIARNPFFPTKPENTFENYGATLGGAIKKDKIFYLGSYEGQTEAVGEPRNATMPEFTSNASQLPQFLAVGPKFSLPAAIQAMQTAGAPISPLSLALTGCSTTTLLCSGAGLFSNTTASSNGLYPLSFPLTGGTNDGVFKVDYHRNDQNSFNAEFFGGKGSIIAPVSSITQPYWSANLYSISYVARAVWIYVPNSSLVNDLRFGWDHSLANENGLLDCNSSTGAPNYASFGLVSGATVCGLPSVTISGFGNLNGQGDSTAISDIYRWADNVSYTHGNHIFKFGGEYALNTGTVNLNIQNSKGSITFNSATGPSEGLTIHGIAAPTSLEYFLAGLPTAATLQVGTVPRSFRYHQFAGYVQDDWRILPRLTLNLGLRYEYMSTVWATDTFFANFAPGTPSGLRQQGNGGPLYSFDPFAFAPRFGFAWDMTGKSTTVLRGSFNIVYEQPTGQVFFSPAATLNINPSGIPLFSGCTANGFTPAALATCKQQVTTPGGTINLANLAINPPSATVPWASGQSIFGGYTNASPACTNLVPCAVGGSAQNLQFPMVLQWNFGIQRALTRDISLDVNYVGNRGQHLFAYTDLNQPTLGANGTAAEQSRRPYTVNGQYPWFGKIGELGSFGEISNYNALQVVLTARNYHGLSFVAGYTYAHALDQGSVDMGMVIPMNSLNPGLEYGNSATDLRHHFTFSPSYMIPGKKAPLQMLEGWQLTSAFTISSGRPYNPIDAVDDFSGSGEGQDRWTLIGNPHDFDGFGAITPVPYFTGANTPALCKTQAALEPLGPQGQTGMASLTKAGCYMAGNSVIIPPAQGMFGTMSRYEIFGPGFEEWDFAISKVWRIKERLNTQFRAEVYNLLNATQYAAPTATLNTGGTFGQSQSTPDIGANSPIIGTGGPRKFQFGLKFTF
jgi:hypothetical protein